MIVRHVLIILLFSSLFITSCDHIFLDSNDGPLLPPKTMTGENTFGCLVDGEVFIPKGRRPGSTVGNSANPKTILEEADGGFQILASNSDFEFIFSLRGEEAVFSTEEMALASFSAYRTFDDIDTCRNYYVIPNSSYLNISYLDTDNDIISGTFHGKFLDPCGDTIHVTDGRFDGEYTK